MTPRRQTTKIERLELFFNDTYLKAALIFYLKEHDIVEADYELKSMRVGELEGECNATLVFERRLSNTPR